MASVLYSWFKRIILYIYIHVCVRIYIHMCEQHVGVIGS